MCLFDSDFDSFQALLSNVTPWPTLCSFTFFALCFVIHHDDINSLLIVFLCTNIVCSLTKMKAIKETAQSIKMTATLLKVL